MKPFEVREYRSPVFAIAICAIGFVLITYSAWSLYVNEGVTVLSVGAMLLTPAFFAGLVEALTTRVVLTQEQITVRSNFRARAYQRSLFSSVSWAKGTPVALQYREGGWLKLPVVSGSGQGLVNTLRVWLARPGA
jgi:hypothetical protein